MAGHARDVWPPRRPQRTRLNSAQLPSYTSYTRALVTLRASQPDQDEERVRVHGYLKLSNPKRGYLIKLSNPKRGYLGPPARDCQRV